MCLSPVCYWKKATAPTEVMGSVGGQLGSLSARLRFPRTFFMTDTCWLTKVIRRAASRERSTGEARLWLCCLALSCFILLTRTLSSSFYPFVGKILFRRSHVRDVAMKRLRFIDDYCRVKHKSLSASLPCGRAHRFHTRHMAKAPHCLSTRLKHEVPAC